jgi:hypothetical protein
VAKVLFERWFCRFSAPTVMISDQGKEFCNELVSPLVFILNLFLLSATYPSSGEFHSAFLLFFLILFILL